MLSAAVYRKSLKVGKVSKGNAANLMDVDPTKVAELCWWIHRVWVNPMQLVCKYHNHFYSFHHKLIALTYDSGPRFIVSMVGSSCICRTCNYVGANTSQLFYDQVTKLSAHHQIVHILKFIFLMMYRGLYEAEDEIMRLKDKRVKKLTEILHVIIPLFISAIDFTLIVLSIFMW